MEKLKKSIISLIAVILMVGLDQATKILAIRYLRGSYGIDLIPGVFRLEFVENRGAAFGIMQNHQYFFAALTVVVLLVIAYVLVKLPDDRKYLLLRIILVALIAGAIGNLIDRVFRTYVVDFLYFCLINFPVFNVADCYVTCSAGALIISLLFVYKENDVDELFDRIGLGGKHQKKEDSAKDDPDGDKR